MPKTATLAAMGVLSLTGVSAQAVQVDARISQEPESSEAPAWNVDKPHTEINFSVKHFFTPVTGSFRSHDIELRFDPENPETSSVSVTIDVASVDTRNERRDNHLRSQDFFNVEEYPRITFRSTSVSQVGPNRYVARGDLTIKGITRQVDLPISLLGVKQIPEGPMREMLGGVSEVASFEASTQLDRREFQVGVANWAQTVIVGGTVDVTITVEANRG